ncbi:hypothetical protein LCGC14_0770830 [marine sediment metagenome]|uniref:Uncharacterized protein n=1 Tax=marine sediment metagenome TaxID=412755 RepID=A0A0F9PYF2_9ZZZZ
MRIYTVYKLIDFHNNREVVRWVGLTAYSLNERLAQHLRDKSNTHKWEWIEKLKTIGEVPEIEPIMVLKCYEEPSIVGGRPPISINPAIRNVERYYVEKYKESIFNERLNPLKNTYKEIRTTKNGSANRETKLSTMTTQHTKETKEMDKCILCKTPDNDKKSDHLRHCYKIAQDKLDQSMYKPRLFYAELNRLQRGGNPICSNRTKCRDRQSIKPILKS